MVDCLDLGRCFELVVSRCFELIELLPKAIMCIGSDPKGVLPLFNLCI